jgi:phage baseplate assembly protein V
MSFELSELQRQLANVVRVGRIVELDEAAARVKVTTGGLITDWLPWGAARAGTTRSTSMPSVGEQVVLFSPFGDTAQAVVGFSLYQDNHPAASTSKDKDVTIYPDGSVVEYDSASNTLTVTVAAAGNVVINCKVATVNAQTSATINTTDATVNASASVTLNTPETTCTGNLTVAGAIAYGQGMTGTGGATINGDFAAQGGAFSHNGKNVGSTHSHSGVTPGGGNTAAPV